MTKARIDALSDGIIAIIITIMVLEMKVPHEATWEAFLKLGPVLLSYILSYVFVAIYWGNHHHLMHTLPKINSKVIWANFLLLFFLSLIPFTTGWMGETLFEKIPVFVYSINLLLTGLAYYILQKTIMKSWQHETVLISALKKQERKGNLSLVLYIASSAFSFYIPVVSVIGFALVSILWVIPDKNIEKALNN